MLPLRLELSLECVACKAAVALNAVAPQVGCTTCGRVVQLSAERWQQLLHAPLDEAPAMRDDEQRDAFLQSPDGVCRRVYRRQPPRCVACGEALAFEAARDSAKPSGWLACGRCQRAILVRALGAIAPSVACFVGEEAELAFQQAPKRAEPVVVQCPACGGALPADGSARAVRCTFCQATAHLPDEVWARLHPTRPVQPFWVWVQAAPAAAPVEAEEVFGEVHEVAFDAAGNVYVGADAGVYSLDARMAPRWARKDIHVDGRALLLFPDGRLWVRGRQSAVLLACADGQSLGPGPEFPRSAISGIFNAYSVQGASVLASTMDHGLPAFRVRRLSLDGAPLAVFEPKKGFFGKLFGGDKSSIDENHGIKLIAASGPDVFVLDAPQFKVQLALAGPDGSERWRWPLGLTHAHLMSYRVAAEPAGTALVAVSQNRSVMKLGGGKLQVESATHGVQLFRVGPSGVTLVRDYPMATKSIAAPTPSGEILVFGSAGEIVRLAPDGREVWANEASKRQSRELGIAAQQN